MDDDAKASAHDPVRDPMLEEAVRRNLISPFVPGTVVSGPSLVIDKYGCAWWVRPENQLMTRAFPAEKVANNG